MEKNVDMAPDRLTVKFINTHYAFMELVTIGAEVRPGERVVSIKLTDEQRKALAPKWVGQQEGKGVYESWEYVCLDRSEEEV